MSQQNNFTKNRHYCVCCQSYFHGKLESHVNTEYHKNNLSVIDWQFLEQFVEPLVVRLYDSKKKTYLCLACNCLMPCNPKYLKSHTSGEKHSYTVEKRCLNILPVQDDQFYCADCDFVITNHWGIPSHVNDESHVTLQRKNMKYRLSKRTTWDTFVHPFVIEKNDQEFYCMVCDSSSSSKEALWVHVKSNDHTRAVKRCKPHLIPLESNFFYCQLCNFVFPFAVNVRAHLIGRCHLNNSTKHPSKDWSIRKDFIAPFIHQAGENDFYCIICDLPLKSAVALESHKQKEVHTQLLDNEINQIVPLENGCFDCHLCQCIIPNQHKVGKHIIGTQHRNKSGVNVAGHRNRSKIASWGLIKNCVEPFLLNENNNNFYCVLCDSTAVGTKALESHILSAAHKIPLVQQCNFIHPLENGSFYCALCDDYILYYRRVNSHLRATRHFSLWSIVAEQENKNHEKKGGAENERKAEKINEAAAVDPLHQPDIKPKTNLIESASTKIHGLPKATKNLDVKCNNSAASTLNSKFDTSAKKLKDFDESLLNFQKTKPANSADCEKTLKLVETAKSTNFEAVAPIAEQKETLPGMKSESNDCFRKFIESFERSELKEISGLECCSETIKTQPQNTRPASEDSMPQWMESLMDLTRILLQMKKSPKVNSNRDKSSENNETLTEQESNKKNLSSVDFEKPRQKNKSSELVDSTNDNLSSSTSTISTSFENSKVKNRVKKSYLERVVSLLDFHENIYDTSERMASVKLSLNLCFIIDSTRNYCLVCREIVTPKHESDNYSAHLCALEHMEKLEKMRKNEEKISSNSRSCNELSMALEFIEILSNEFARCLVCQIKISNNDSFLLNHIVDEDHQKAREKMSAKAQKENALIVSRVHCDWYKVQKYECIACSKKFDLEIDFVEHLLDDEKHANHMKTIVNDGAKMIYEFCSICALIYCTRSNVQINHIDCSSHKWFVRNGPFVVDDLPQSTTKLLISLIKNKNYQTTDVSQEIEENCKSSIVKAYGKGTGHHYNSTFDTEPPIQDIQFIKFFSKICPSSVDMISFLKQWLVECDLFGTQQISIVALYWYVILYLQTISILPNIATLNSMKLFCRELADWEKTSKMRKYEEFVLREHLVGFFSLYANFDYRYDVACPLIGKVIDKRAFADNFYHLPEEMKSYVSYMRNREFAEPFRIDSVMCLQDPFDLQNNLTKSVSKFDLSRFRNFCSKSFSFLYPKM